MHHFNEYPDTGTQAVCLAQTVTDELSKAIATNGRATLAVSGGTTPAAFLTQLSMMELDWSRVTVMFTDERFVSEDSDRSNARLLKETLLQGPAKSARFVPFVSRATSPQDAAQECEPDIRKALPLDVCVLGMGADMHIASLFPDAENLDEGLSDASEATLLPMRPASAPETRLSLTAPVLTGAAHLHLLIKGEEKRAALERASKASSPAVAPVKILLGRDALTIHYCEGASQ